MQYNPVSHEHSVALAQPQQNILHKEIRENGLISHHGWGQCNSSSSVTYNVTLFDQRVRIYQFIVSWCHMINYTFKQNRKVQINNTQFGRQHLINIISAGRGRQHREKKQINMILTHNMSALWPLLFMQPSMSRMRICFTDVFSVFFHPSKNTRQPFSRMAEQIFTKLLPNDIGENVVSNVVPKWGLGPQIIFWGLKTTHCTLGCDAWWVTQNYFAGYGTVQLRAYGGCVEKACEGVNAFNLVNDIL